MGGGSFVCDKAGEGLVDFSFIYLNTNFGLRARRRALRIPRVQLLVVLLQLTKLDFGRLKKAFLVFELNLSPPFLRGNVSDPRIEGAEVLAGGGLCQVVKPICEPLFAGLFACPLEVLLCLPELRVASPCRQDGARASFGLVLPLGVRCPHASDADGHGRRLPSGKSLRLICRGKDPCRALAEKLVQLLYALGLGQTRHNSFTILPYLGQVRMLAASDELPMIPCSSDRLRAVQALEALQRYAA